MSRKQARTDPAKRAAKRQRQRAVGYQGIKKKTPFAIMGHNRGMPYSGRSDRDKRFYETGDTT